MGKKFSRKIEIRRARKGDLRILIAFSDHFSDYHHRLDPLFKGGAETHEATRKIFIASLSNPKKRLLVAVVGKGIAGYCLGEIIASDFPTRYKEAGYLTYVYVRDEYRRTGIGGHLLRHLFRWFREKKLSYAELSVHSKNELGLRAWQKFGFREYARRMRIRL